MYNALAMDRRDQLLLRETGLAAQSLGAGLEAIAAYTFPEKGRFYAGMHSLCVGFERLLKVILVLDHEITHGRMPDNQYLKSVGHGIEDLVVRARKINATRQLDVDEELFGDTLTREILSIINDFAVHARYYNLDSLTGDSKAGDRDPLERWEFDVQPELIRRHFKQTANTRLTEAICDDLHRGGGISVHHTRGDGSVIQDMRSFGNQSVTIGVCQRYGVLYVHSVTRFCAEVLDRLDTHLQNAADLSRLLILFRDRNRSAIMRKKRWDPYRL